MGLFDFLKKKPASSGGGVTIKVGPRDTLRSLARKYYDDESVYIRIYEANKWRIDGDELVPGQDCLLPTVAGKGPKADA
ncbi:MAG: hypothetical protein FJ033_01955 [Chloroflexi bacterium]|nr:hypothetical protein [Chloroflexota bacterium]